jgi:hypothetical protein
MSYQLQTEFGGTEAVIDDNCGISKFYAIAYTLSEDLKVVFVNQVQKLESLEWDFKYKEHFLSLHYNVFNGVSITKGKSDSIQSENKGVLEVAHFLVQKTF